MSGCRRASGTVNPFAPNASVRLRLRSSGAKKRWGPGVGERKRIEVLQIGSDLTLALHSDGRATYSTEDGTERDVLVAVMKARIGDKLRISFLEEWMTAWGEPVASSFKSEDGLRAALEDARHELTTLHGLYAFDGAAPKESWRLDTSKTLAKIDGALGEPGRR